MKTDAPVAPVLPLLGAILAELRGLRADLRRGDRLRDLRGALAEEFADSPFTVAGVLEVADSEPDSALARILRELVDLTAPERNRATALGRLLGSVPWIVTRGERRGSALYVLADFDA